ncbi:SGNH/GDSL hydrolase family protein [Mucilaginibacter boryungensis]|uniref:SGNH/GDSL hydrolase family protein n=1 Tax=Mucilaginibacter boryungensis TaxID=768480 RepID=A0ABR9XIE4_9SPHI|nr:SGNH/GDSL hydrolase family protein [Mucilaginibacter boryungensis]MBE9667152.1 SGNH/GDSL hydrolase family protein [Mucilaginibacter boryungensis]
MENTRRSFIRNAAIGTLASLTLPEIASAAFAEAEGKKIRLDVNDVVLFQGDSITDAGRDKTKTIPNDIGCMGNGYALVAGSGLLVNYPDKKLQIYNKGVSGNKVYQLAARWDTDCLDLKPNVLSIFVGVNDFWHTMTAGYKGTIETYRTDYKKLLDRTKQALPDVKLIIGEPYAVNGVNRVTDIWYPKFYEFQAAAREIAEEYDTGFVPFQSVIDKAMKTAPGAYWTRDGVHPNMAGITLLAHAWLAAIK